MAGWRARRPAPDDPRPAGDRGGDAPAARLRTMVPADLVDVIALEHELFPDDPWTPEMFADEVARPSDSRLYLIAEADAGDGGVRESEIVSGAGAVGGPVVAGYAGMMFVPGGSQADVLTIAVRPAYWGKGIGSELLGTLLATAQERGCWEVFLEVRADNPRAHGLYLRRGFKEIGVRRGYYQPSGVDAIVMRKELVR